MGLFSFIKEAGAAILGGQNTSNDDQAQQQQIVDFVSSNNIGVDNFKVNVEGDTANIAGDVTSQADREKLILAVGNIEGIAQVKDDLLTVSNAAPNVEPKFYVVKAGDTLSKIAKECYGDPMKYDDIFNANRPLLNDPDSIYPGQTLRIPDAIA